MSSTLDGSFLAATLAAITAVREELAHTKTLLSVMESHVLSDDALGALTDAKLVHESLTKSGRIANDLRWALQRSLASLEDIRKLSGVESSQE